MINRIQNLRLITLLCYIGMSNLIFAHANDPIKKTPTTNLICNDNVQLSLDEDCQVPLTAQLVLVGNPSGSFTFDIRRGNTSFGAVANATMVGKTYEYTATDATGNMCWGYLKVEDKTAPKAICPTAPIAIKCDLYNTLNVSLTEKNHIGALPAGVSLTDNCSTPKITYSDAIDYLPCTNALSAIITRTYKLSDASGNTASCAINFNIEKRTLAEVTMPADVSIDCEKISNKKVPTSLGGSPKLGTTDVYPNTSSACSLSATYTDTPAQMACGKTFKMTRNWVVTDCAGNIKTSTQLITVHDIKPPVFESCPVGTIEISATGINCVGENIKLTLPKAKDLCDSFPTVRAMIKKGAAIIAAGLPANNIPIGNYTIEYIATDACNNSSVCTQNLKIVDNIPPVAVCDQNTKLSLTADGTAVLRAESIDDGSIDNCCLDNYSFLIKRNSETDAAYARFITFDCKDSLVMVTLRVADCNGNTNICMVNVRVEDKIPPVITARDTSVFCSTNNIAEAWLDKNRPQRASLVAYPTALLPGYFDNTLDCGFELTFKDDKNISNCGTGTYTRIWTLKDNKGFSATAVQKYVSAGNFNYSVIFPSDVLLNIDANCNANTTEPDNTGRPKINYAPNTCATAAIRYQDEVVDASGNNVCYQIKRTWQIINICEPMTNLTPIARSAPSVTATYNSANRGSFEYVQFIKIQDGNAPTWTKIPDVTIGAAGKDCAAKIVIAKPEANDCTSNLLFTYEVYKSNGILVKNGASFPADITVSPNDYGNYSVIYRVSDRCGNINSSMKPFTVKDLVKPTPICHQNIATSLGMSGMSMVNASVFDAGSFDNCTAIKDLDIRIQVMPMGNVIYPDTLPNMYTFKCLPKYVPSSTFIGYRKFVRLWVGDKAGNWDYCDTEIEVQDNFAVCDYEAIEMRAISGNIATEKGKSVENVRIALEGYLKRDQNTPNSGKFNFENVPTLGTYTIRPEKNTNPLNGVSTYDLLMINKHILGIETLKSPYQIIAADVNKSGTVTTADIVELRRMILALQPTFNKNESWRFVDKNYQFTDPNKPFAQAIPEQLTLNSLALNTPNEASFVAVKIGDINQNATTSNFTNAGGRQSKTAQFEVKDMAYAQNEVFNVSFSPTDDLEGYQFTLSYPSEQLELEAIDGDEKGFALLENGTLTVSQMQAQGFELRFRAKKNGILSQSLTLNSSQTIAEAYMDGQVSNLQLYFAKAINNEFEIFQNQPNPFEDFTTIGFHLPESDNVELRIIDINGHIVSRQSQYVEKGRQQWTINKQDLPQSGIFYYEITTSKQKASKKMIIH